MTRRTNAHIPTPTNTHELTHAHTDRQTDTHRHTHTLTHAPTHSHAPPKEARSKELKRYKALKIAFVVSTFIEVQTILDLHNYS